MDAHTIHTQPNTFHVSIDSNLNKPFAQYILFVCAILNYLKERVIEIDGRNGRITATIIIGKGNKNGLG